MKNLMGAPSGNTNEMQGLANKCTEGVMTQLVNSMNDFFVSVSADMPGLDPTHRVVDIEEPLPAEFTLEAASTQRALQNVKYRKAIGPDNIPPWMVNNYAHLLAAPSRLFSIVRSENLRQAPRSLENCYYRSSSKETSTRLTGKRHPADFTYANIGESI